MQCPQCGSPDMVTSKKEDYHYTESGLNNVILKGITVHQCQKCGEQFPVIPRIIKLHGRIARALLAKPSVLTGEEFRFLRKEMRLKASELASIMGVHKVTVSRWETNAEPIGPSADRLLRYIYATRHMKDLAEHLPHLWQEDREQIDQCAGKRQKEVIQDMAAASDADIIQGAARWLETRVKLIRRTQRPHEPIAIDPAEVCT